MKIAHLSDTHLGHRGQGVQRPVADPWRPGVWLRQQELDIMSALAEAIDRIVGYVAPDLVIHSGDLFDGARPTPHALNFAMGQFRRLADAGIPTLIIEGNHSWPRDCGQGHALQLLAHLPGVRAICGEPEVVRLPGVTVHALPHQAIARGHCPDQAALDTAGANILVAHAVADGLHFFKTGRPAPDLAVAPCADWYDYVALGHCHRFGQVPGTERAFYAGATAMVLPGDFRPGHQFGINVVTLGAATPSVERQVVTTRPMLAYGLDDAEGLAPAEVLTFLARQADAVPPDGAYCRVIVERLDPLARRELAVREVDELFARAAGRIVSLRAREQRWEAVHEGLLAGGSPSARFAHLVLGTDGGEHFKAEVLALGQQLLARAAEQLGRDDAETPDGDGEGT